jgi:hypothetical protein
MLFNFKRFKKIAILLIFLMAAITLASFWENIISEVDGLLETGRKIVGIKRKADEIDDVLSGDDEGKGGNDKGVKVERVVTVVTEEEELEVEVEEARSEEEIATGLMYRGNICENCGMLFYFEEDRRGGFWMKNCEISLDIIFIDESGEIIDIKEDFEPCDEEPCPSYSPDEAYRYVLEVNGGWCRQNDVMRGDKIRGIN